MNHRVSGFEVLSPNGVCDTLVLGADLIHPKATSAEVCPTVACLAASIDGVFAKFIGSARRQTARQEIVDSNNLIEMVTEALTAWKNNNASRLPARILYYRDGTGDSQYAGILREVSAIKTAWRNVAGPQQSREVIVTAVVGVKRHTTRFFPSGNGRKTRTGNIIPGSVISSDITSPHYSDFYLQSHDVEKGSAKPTLYRVLENGMNFTEEGLQDLTNAFCYNFSHSTTAVSYASPAYYADRLCERCMLYLREFFDNDPSVQNLASDNAKRAQLEIAWGRGGQGIGRNPWNKNFNEVMFWM